MPFTDSDGVLIGVWQSLGTVRIPPKRALHKALAANFTEQQRMETYNLFLSTLSKQKWEKESAIKIYCFGSVIFVEKQMARNTPTR